MRDMFGMEIEEAPVKGGYAAHPGSGPQDRTCGDCKYFEEVFYHNKKYFKCALVKWTHGPGTDIRKNWQACRKFYGKASDVADGSDG
jgi:hypothetical protein